MSAPVRAAPTNAQARVQGEKDIRFLASDEMRGRDTGSPELDKAGEYILQSFRDAGLDSVFYQSVPLVRTEPTQSATISIQDQAFMLEKDLLVLAGGATKLSAPIVFAGYGLERDLEGLDLEGKIVVTNAGSEDELNPQAFYGMAFEKMARLEAAGAVAVVELFRSQQVGWSQLVGFLGGGGLKLDPSDGASSSMPLIWLHDPSAALFAEVRDVTDLRGSVNLTPGARTEVAAHNVIGMQRGTDATLADQWVVVSAHYDHIGIGRPVEGDSIYNGARDNAMGTAALLRTARTLGAERPRRNTIFLACTAEEKGLLGSEYYAENPIIPLKQTHFNLNFDGAGYDDTTSVVFNGHGRNTLQAMLDEAVEGTGLTAKPDPEGQERLYQFSDNWNFAKRGVPAINMAPGFTGFSPELMKYYHQPPDEPDALDFGYVERYTRAASTAASTLLNSTAAPAWVDDDPLKSVGDALYD